MKATQYLVQALEREGVEVVFGYPGGAIMPFYDALLEAKFKHILVRHEQGAALAADGYARATGKVGVCLATSGPGATNLITGLANAYLDSVPVVAITGQVPSTFLGTDAFQEVDVVGMTMPIVKHSFLPRTAAELAEVVPQAFQIARSGRPGPVVIDMPKDVSLSEVPPVALDPGEDDQPFTVDAEALQTARTLLAESSRPVIYAGGGIGIAGAVPTFMKFVETCRIPTATTLKGLGAIPTKHPLFLGMLGMHGLRAANVAIQECDLLLVVGARFDDRATGKLAEFAPSAKVIHLDIDPAEVGKLRAPQAALVGPLVPHLEALAQPLAIDDWRERCAEQVQTHRWNYQPPVEGIYAPRLLRQLSEVAGPNAVISCDVGQHQMWVAQHCHFHHPSRHLTSGGLGTMGFGLPAAIGAQLGCPDSLVIAVSGDGSIMMNIQELATLARYGIPVKILLLDNHCLGLVRQWQELFFEKRFSSVNLDDNPDFVAVAEAFGIPAMAFRERADEPRIVEALTQTKGPFLAHVLINPEANVWPLVPPGKSNSHMMEEVQA